MAGFQVLNEESKILRRKEKEAERQQKIKEKLTQAQTPNVGSWADASDEDEEDEKLFRPVSDSESEQSDADSDRSPTKEGTPSKKKDKGYPEDGSTTNGKAKADPKAEPKIDKAKAGKKEKQASNKQVKEEEDLDAILADMGLEVVAETAEASASSRRRKKKGAAEVQAEDGNESKAKEANGEKPKAAAKKAEKEKPKEDAECEEEDKGEDAPVDREAALKALREKQAKSKAGSKQSDAAKYAAAEAKKRAANQKTKKDKSMYDR